MIRRGARKRLTPLPKAVIICEGKVTEPQYLNGLRVERRLPESRVVIHRAKGDPKRVVDEAVRLKKLNDAENARDKLDVKDTVWAVFDRDDHLEIPEAKQKARANDVRIVFSNPCFELFLLFHFTDLTRDEHRDVVTRLLRDHMPDYVKKVDYRGYGLHARYNDAKRRCETVNLRSELTAGIESAPYCCGHNLIDYLLELRLS